MRICWRRVGEMKPVLRLSHCGLDVGGPPFPPFVWEADMVLGDGRD